MLISFEGIDGSGKTVQSKALKKSLEEEGFPCSLFSFPAYETSVGELIFEHLHDKKEAFSLNPRVVSILYATNRLELCSQILDALDQGSIVICNRYTYSNAAFQGAKVKSELRNKLIEWIEELEFDLFKLPRPDLTFFLALPPEKTINFVTEKKDKTELGPDEYEKDREFSQTVFDIYSSISTSRSDWIPIQCYENDVIFSKERIAKLVFDFTKPRLKDLSQ